jgi:hypothetical protein
MSQADDAVDYGGSSDSDAPGECEYSGPLSHGGASHAAVGSQLERNRALAFCQWRMPLSDPSLSVRLESFMQDSESESDAHNLNHWHRRNRLGRRSASRFDVTS